MSNITAGDLKSKLEQVLAIASMLDPKVALAMAGVDVLKQLFGKTGELSAIMDKVYAETVETAPETAQAVSEFYKAKGDALEESFQKHPGS